MVHHHVSILVIRNEERREERPSTPSGHNHRSHTHHLYLYQWLELGFEVVVQLLSHG